MASSINDMINAEIDKAINEQRIAESDRNAVSHFFGLSGGVSERGARRYYLSGQLNEYVDIAPEDVVGEVNLAGNESPFVLVLTKRDTSVQHHLDISESVESRFLEGLIASQNLTALRPPQRYGDITPVATLTFSTPWTCFPWGPQIDKGRPPGFGQ